MNQLAQTISNFKGNVREGRTLLEVHWLQSWAHSGWKCPSSPFLQLQGALGCRAVRTRLHRELLLGRAALLNGWELCAPFHDSFIGKFWATDLEMFSLRGFYEFCL